MHRDLPEPIDLVCVEISQRTSLVKLRGSLAKQVKVAELRTAPVGGAHLLDILVKRHISELVAVGEDLILKLL